jgi:acetyl esterase/lipase
MSVASSVIDSIIKQFNKKDYYEDDNKFQEYLERQREINSRKHKMMYPFHKSIIVENQKISNMQYYVFNRNNCKKTIFYFHGGAYISRPNIFHYRFLERVLREKDVCVVFPIYPRLPDSNYEICYKKLKKLYCDFIEKNEVEEVIFMGDSAGGGLALGIAQQVKKDSKYYNEGKQKIIMLCPWLDVSTDNKGIVKIRDNDYQLHQVWLQKLGKLWAIDNTKKSPASPLFGDVDCGEITLFTGTREILYPDCLLLKHKVESCGGKINFYSYKNMSHCFMLMPTPEAENAIKDIIKHI